VIGNVYRLGLIDNVIIEKEQHQAFIFKVPKCWGVKKCSTTIKNVGNYSGETMFPQFGISLNSQYYDFSIEKIGLYSAYSDQIRDISLAIRFENQSTFIYEDSIRVTYYLYPQTPGLNSLIYPQSNWVGANYGICHRVVY
jgi:hypothetical protein